jgi:hypothetical protein
MRMIYEYLGCYVIRYATATCLFRYSTANVFLAKKVSLARTINKRYTILQRLRVIMYVSIN